MIREVPASVFHRSVETGADDRLDVAKAQRDSAARRLPRRQVKASARFAALWGSGIVASGIFFGIHRLANGIKNEKKIIGRGDSAELIGLGQDFEFARLQLMAG